MGSIVSQADRELGSLMTEMLQSSMMNWMKTVELMFRESTASQRKDCHGWEMLDCQGKQNIELNFGACGLRLEVLLTGWQLQWGL